jgi:uncharacterized protein (TIGR02996 family)
MSATHREPPMSSTRAALEAALAADPDDVARHAAYADLLIEEGDPRGEFIRLQLALEDPDLPADRRKAMESASWELRRQYEDEWVGPIRRWFYIDVFPGFLDVTPIWWRGWVRELSIIEVNSHLFHALLAMSTIRLLHRFRISDVEEGLGTETPRLLADFLARTTVRDVRVSMPEYGDSVVKALIESRLIDQLTDLNLAGCGLTDDGAVTLASHPSVPRLKSLRLDENYITPLGASLLSEVGITVGPQQWDAGRGRTYV